MKSLRKKSTNNWINYYNNYLKIKEFKLNKKLNFFQEEVLLLLKKNILKFNKKKIKILNAGSGIDKILLNLELPEKKLERNLLDISKVCLNKNKILYDHYSISASFIKGDIFNTKLAKNSYDVIYNTGVLEHFNKFEQKKIVDEMIRILKPGGKFLTFNPSSNGKLYVSALEHAKKNNRFPHFEIPVETLEHGKENKNISNFYESHLAPLSQVYFLKYFLPEFLGYKFVYVLNLFLKLPILKNFSKKIIKHYFGNYLLLSVFEKKH